MKKLLFICIGIAALLFSQKSIAQFDIPEKPSSQTSVYDYAGVLSASEKSQLEEKLIRYADTTSTQIVVITIKSLNGSSIESLTPDWAQKWGIGQKDKDNGVLILLAEKERKIWISPGYGVDKRLTAGRLGELTRNVIIPEFKAGSYYRGLDKGTDAMIEMLQGTYKEERPNGGHNSGGSDGAGAGIFIFFIVLIIIIISIIRGGGGGGRGGRRRGFGSTLADILILSSLGRSGGFGGGGGFRGGGGFGGGGGGGFGGGFGGGGFSGGGAGGSW